MGLLAWVKRLFARPPMAVHSASPFPAGTGPARLVILRHAEKTGDRNDPHLSLAGRRRAEQLVDYLPATFGRPHFLMAARTSQRSRRPVETLEPLAAALALDIRAKLDDDDGVDLVEALGDKQRYRGKSGVICWRHSELPRLVDALGAAEQVCPRPWDDNDYATIIDVGYPGDGTAVARRWRMPF